MIKQVMQKFYRQADGHPERLPWHDEEPNPMLDAAVAERKGRGRALDVGCGAGVFSVWMARQGMDVTGLDMFPEAVAMGEARARENRVKVDFVLGDLFQFSPAQPFDIVFDSGCLHSLVGGSTEEYKRQVLRWLAPGGELVLAHWGKRNALDWRPIGPRRRSEETIAKMFAPELRILATEVKDFAAPLPFGPTVRGISYRMAR